MPTLHRIGRCRIVIFTHDHEPPHVHLQAPGFALKVELGTWNTWVIRGNPRDAKDALEWVRRNESLLRRHWRTIHGGVE